MRNRIEDIVLRFLEKPGMLLRFFIPGKFLKITVGTLCALLIVVPGFETAFGKSEEMSEIAVSPAAQALYEAATPYVGSVSEVSGLLHILRENGIFPEEEGTMELLTEEPPYGLVIHFKNAPKDEDTLCSKMYNSGLLLWALVGNLENVEWSFPSKNANGEIQETYYLGKNELQGAYGTLKNIKEYGQSPEKVEQLMRLAGIEKTPTPELKNPHSMAADTSSNRTEETEDKSELQLTELPVK